jgi:hypothetical protein
MAGAKFTSPYGKEVKKYLSHGVGIHHAGCCRSIACWWKNWRSVAC